MPWDQIANNLNVTLKDVKQYAGSALAKPSMWDSDTAQEVYFTKKMLKLVSDRMGSSRTATGCKYQARKFGDINELLANSDLPVGKQRSLEDMLLYLGGGIAAAADVGGEGSNHKGKDVEMTESSPSESPDGQPVAKKAKRKQSLT
jgi:hypothetical protein